MNTTEFEQALDHCVERIARHGSGVDECLALYPQYAKDLEPLLSAAVRFNAGRALQPSAAYKEKRSASLKAYANAHPPKSESWYRPAWRTALASAALVLVLVFSTTAFAQGALPGEALYPWKLSSEQVWRAVAPDPVGVDLVLADRRADELTLVAHDASLEAEARDGLHQVLSRLESEDNTDNGPRIQQALKSHDKKLQDAGIQDPELDKLVHGKGKP